MQKLNNRSKVNYDPWFDDKKCSCCGRPLPLDAVDRYCSGCMAVLAEPPKQPSGKKAPFVQRSKNLSNKRVGRL